jgi:hypothetical protein
MRARMRLGEGAGLRSTDCRAGDYMEVQAVGSRVDIGGAPSRK